MADEPGSKNKWKCRVIWISVLWLSAVALWLSRRRVLRWCRQRVRWQPLCCCVMALGLNHYG